MKNSVIAAAILVASFLSSTAFASDTVYISICMTAAECQDGNLKSHSISVTGGRGDDVLIYDAVNHKTYQYGVVDDGGNEYPGMGAGAYKEGVLDEEANNAVADTIGINANPIVKTLDDVYGRTGRAVEYDTYSLSQFDSNFTYKDISAGLSILRYEVQGQLDKAYRALHSSILDHLKRLIEINWNTVASSTKLNSKFSDGEADFLLTGIRNGIEWGIVTTASVEPGNRVESNFKSILLFGDVGNVIFEILTENNRIDVGDLVGRTFNTVNPASVRPFFQGLGVDISWYAGCEMCRTYITHIDDPNAGEVHPD